MMSFIFAMDENRVIGRDNQLPWHLPADLQYFKKVTLGKTVIMGRKTYASIGRPLPGRKNVVLTRDPDFTAPGCEVIHSLDDVQHYANEDFFVVGGAEIYEKLLDQADYLYVTKIAASFEGDAFFPEIDPAKWRLVSETQGVVDEKNRYPHSFLVYRREGQADA